MNNEQIVANNILIAEFMGYYKSPYENIDNKMYIDLNGEEYSTPIEQLIYHKSYDFLMPVVNKIQGFYIKDKANNLLFFSDLNFSINIEDGYTQCIITGRVFKTLSPHKHENLQFEQISVEKDNTIDSIYETVITFINWYNQHK